MNSGLRRALVAEYKRRLGAVVRKTVGRTGTDSLSADIEDLENYSKLIALSESPWAADSTVALVIALGCLLITAILWSTQVRKTDISLVAETESLNGRLDSDWRLDTPLQSGFIHLERLGRISAPNLGLNIDSANGDAWLRLEGGTVSIQSLAIPKGSYLELTSENEELTVYCSLKPLRGTITVFGNGRLTAGNRPSKELLNRAYALPEKEPEIIEFEAVDAQQVPSQITIHNPKKWNFGKIRIRSIGFASETSSAPGESEFRSGAKSGSIRFNDTSWPKFEIVEDTMLEINGTQQADVQVRGGARWIHVTLSGMVAEVNAGDRGTKKRLAPSYLEYLYGKKTFTLFWAAIAGGWGVLWGIRKTVFR